MMHEGMEKVCVPFGVIVFLIGLAYVLKDLGYISFGIGMWPLLVLFVGLAAIGCGMTCCKPEAKA